MTGLSASAIATRRGRITGTTATGIIGVSPFITAFDAYMEVLGLAETPDNAAMRLGRRLQKPTADEWAEMRGVEIAECETQAHPTLDWLAASGDYHVLDGSGALLEIKTTSLRNEWAWGPDGGDEIPLHVLVQVVVQMAVYDAPLVYVCVLIGGQDLRSYAIPRNLELERAVLGELERFYYAHILPEIPPAIDGSEAAAEFLRARYPRDTGEVLDATAEVDEWLLALKEARETLHTAEAAKLEAENHIKAFLGEASELRSVLGRVTYRKAKDTPVVNFKALVASLEVPAETVAAFTTIKPGSRRFLPTFEGDGESEESR